MEVATGEQRRQGSNDLLLKKVTHLLYADSWGAEADHL
jgi:hypothetical protein